MRHLRQRRLQALAVAVRADPQLEPAVRREARQRRLVARHERNAPGRIDAGAVAGLLGVHGEADADAAAVGLARFLALRAPGRSRWPRWRGAGPRDSRRSRNGAWRYCRTASARAAPGSSKRSVVRLAADLAGERVERHLEREAHAGAGDPAVGQDRRLVGGDRVRAAAVVRESRRGPAGSSRPGRPRGRRRTDRPNRRRNRRWPRSRAPAAARPRRRRP